MLNLNPLFDIEFLIKLMENRSRETFIKLTALTLDELPIEYIEGRATGGTLNIDGASALRRTCNVSLVAQDVNINDFYWGYKNKFILEIGVKNKIDNKYPEIIWFKQGLFIITSFTTSQTNNSYTISISGKDKMCLLNGEIAGALPHTTDFGVEEMYDAKQNITTYKKILLRDIIREAVQNFGNELPQNIIINDLDDVGLELLEYRGDNPLYLFRDISGQIRNATLNPELICYIDDGTAVKVSDDKTINYDELSGLLDDNPTKVELVQNSKDFYTVVRFQYGDLGGYRLTDLVYAGDLIANIGETLVSVLDKIKNFLGDFEYFYNIDGKFVFQKKRTYIQTPWNTVQSSDEKYIDNAINTSFPMYNFTNAKMISSFNNNPDLMNLRNDFSVWGTHKSISGAEIPIHMRYAIDTKPTKYKTIPWLNEDGTVKKESKEYTTDEWDWRELIYQMALDYRQNYHDDDFLFKVQQNNPEMLGGKTGYEQYYIDLEGFWRLLYNPEPDPEFESIEVEEIKENDQIYIQNYYSPMSAEERAAALNQDENVKYFKPEEVYVLRLINTNNESKWMIYPFIGASEECHLIPGSEYYVYNIITGDYDKIKDENKLNLKNLFEIYVKDDNGTFVSLIDEAYKDALNGNTALYVKREGFILFDEIEDDDLKSLYREEGKYKEDITRWKIENNYGTLSSSEEESESILYATAYYNYHNDKNTGDYWSYDVENNPTSLIFWFDFLDPEDSNLSKYSVPTVGARTKAINDNDVKAIYYRDVPTTIFKQSLADDTYEHQSGYTYIQLPPSLETLFTISTKGKSAKERIDELLYYHSYCIEKANLSVIPVYHLEPNSRIIIKDEKSKIDGEYIVQSVSIPLSYNGMMNLTATKVVSSIV